MKKNIIKTPPPAGKKQRGQVFVAVLIMAVVLSLISMTLLHIFQANQTLLVRFSDMQTKQQLASTALEHAVYNLQGGSNWDTTPGSPGFAYDVSYTVSNLGWYELNIVKGNLFIKNNSRQGVTDYRTVGIKVKVGTTGMTSQYFGVIRQSSNNGVLVSNGQIFSTAECTSNAINNNYYNFFWGDIYSANPNDGMCYYPIINIGSGNINPQPWLPEVYAKGNIYTAVNGDNSGYGSTTYTFGYVYDDMSPTAKSHPYSPMAISGSLDLNYWKMLAYQNGAYYGPQTIGGGGTNPYYIAGNSLTWAMTYVPTAIVNKLNTLSQSSVVFIDTTDALPERNTGNINTYNGTTSSSAANTIQIFGTNTTYEYWTAGYLFVNGPLILTGNNPSRNNGTPVPSVTGVVPPDNYYAPQASDSYHYTCGTAGTSCYLANVKHNGFIYVNGQLAISGAQQTDVCIYGQIFLDQYGSIDATNTGTNQPTLEVYFNDSLNALSYAGNTIQVVTFNELTWLIPAFTGTPVF